ncbi:putative ribonuclease H-like domain-containing protein [Tanacetum coccineum]
MVPRTVLTRSSPILLNTARPVNTVQPRTAVNNAGPMKNIINNAYSTARRPFNKITAANNSDFTKKVNIVKGIRVNTARPKEVLSAVKGNKGNDVKASACWFWKPKHKVLEYVSRNNGASISFKRFYYIYAQGRSRCDNRTEFKNRIMNQFCEMKGIKGEFSVTRTPQQNGVAKWKNRTLIEAARTMLADSKLPTTFWAEAVNTACYVQNRVLVIKPHNKTPYELFLGRKPALSFMRPFGYPVTILNTIDHLGKFDGKANEGFFIGYSTNSKAFRVFNSQTRIVEENLHVQFSENIPNITGSGPNWLFDIDALIKSMNYKAVVVGNQSNSSADTKACDNAGKARVETVPGKDYILLPLWTQDPSFSSSSKDSPDAGFKPLGEEKKKDAEDPGNESGNPPEGKDSEVPSIKEPRINQEKDASVNNTNNINTVSPTVNAASIEDNAVNENIVYGCADDPNILDLEEIGRFSDVEDDGVEADEFGYTYPLEPKKVIQALKDLSWIEAMQDELLPFKLQLVWTLVDLPHGKRAIGHTQEEGIDYDEVFATVARIEAIRLFLAYASYKDFVVYQMDVKSAFLYGKIKEEVYVCQLPGFKDPDFPGRVYKVEKALYGLHQAPKAWSTRKELRTEFEKMTHKKFQMSFMGKLTFFLGLQVNNKEDGIFIIQDKYVTEILKKFGFSDVKTASTPMETHKPLLKDADGKDIDEHMYRLMIGSLMYLTSSRPDIMFPICVCARFQVNPKVSHLHVVKRIFRYLKGQPKLGLWYPKDSPFDLVAYTDSDYAGASLDMKSIIGGCQFLGCRLISWQCKKQTVVANSITEAEYVAASSYCGQVLWIQNQLLDYGYNFMQTKIHIDNGSTISIVKNLVFHSKTKHIEIRHHFIRDSNKKKLIQMIKIHIDKNVTDLLTKAFDLGINVLLLGKVNAAMHNLLLLVFWSTAKVKMVNGEVQLQALVDGKKIIITEACNIRDLIRAIHFSVQSDPNWDSFEVVRGVVMQEPSETATRPTIPPQQHDPKDKGKGKMVEQEKPLKKKDQIKFDEEIAQRLQAQMQAELEDKEMLVLIEWILLS